MEFDFFTTTLSISTLKNAEKLNEIGKAKMKQSQCHPESMADRCDGFTAQKILRSGRVISLAPEWAMETGKREREIQAWRLGKDVATLVNQ